jgi:hypothetical protein
MRRTTESQINSQKAATGGDKKAAILFGRRVVEKSTADTLKAGDEFKMVEGGSARSAYTVVRKDGVDATLSQMGHRHEVQFASPDQTVYKTVGRK